MTTIAKHTELLVRVAYQPGALSNPMAFARSCGVDVLATCSYWDGASSFLLLVADDSAKAGRAFHAAGYQYTVQEVILVGPLDSAAEGARHGEAVAEAGIKILYAYGYQTECDEFYQVFKTADDERTLRVLQPRPVLQEAALSGGRGEPRWAR